MVSNAPAIHESNAEGDLPRDRLAQEHRREHERQGEAQLVHGGDAGRGAELERAKIRQPRDAGGDAGQNQEQERPTGDFPEGVMLAAANRDRPSEVGDHDRADRRREVRWHALDPDLREDRGEPPPRR